MDKVLKCTCSAIVLSIRSFVFPCPRCHRRRGLLKVPKKESEKRQRLKNERIFYLRISRCT